MGRAGVLMGLLTWSALAWGQATPFDDSEFEGPEETQVEPNEERSGFAVPVVDDLDEGSELDAPASDASRRLEGEEDPAGEADEPPLLPSRGPGSLAPRRPHDPEPNPSAARGPAPPPPPAPGPPGSTHEVVSESAIARVLQRRATAMMTGDLGAAERALNELVEIKRNLGLRNIPVAATLLVHDARTALEAERIDAAVRLADYATRLAPDLPAAHWVSAVALSRQDPTQVVQIGGAAIQTFRSWVVPFRNAVTFWSWALASIGFGFIAVAIGFSLIQLAKYLRYPAHDISSRLPGVFGTGEFQLVLLTGILAPYALGFGAVTSVVVGLAVIFAHQTLRERITSSLLTLGLVATPFVLQWAAPFVAFHGSDVDALVAAYSENVDPATAARIDGLARDDPSQRLVFARINAHRSRQRGDLASAREWYETVVEEAPSDAAAQNNLAVLDFLAGEQEASRRRFEQAARSSDLAEPRLNLSLLLADEGQFAEADTLLVQARRIDPVLTEAFTSLDGVRPAAQRFVEVPLQEAFLWARFFDVPEDRRQRVTAELWRPVGGSMPELGFVAVAVLAWGVATLMMRRRDRLSVPCSKCGRPAPGAAKTSFCDQCISVFVSGVAVEPRVRQNKEVEVRRFQRRRRWAERILSLTGLGLVVGGRPFAGVVLGFVVAACVGAVVTLPLLSVSAWSQPVGDEARTATITLFAVVALGAAAISVRRSWER